MQYCIKVKLNSVLLCSSLSQLVKRSDVQGLTTEILLSKGISDLSNL